MEPRAAHDELRLAPAIRAALDGLRRRIRQYVWIEGLAAAVAWLGAAFWVSLAADWLFEPPKGVRGAVVAAAAIGLTVVLVRWIGRRAFVRLSDSNMAMLLERRFPQLGDCLLTAVVLAPRGREQDACDQDMLACTCREAGRRIEGVELARLFNFAPLRRSLLAALVLGWAAAAFAVAAPAAMGVWARRTLSLTDELWPRRTRLSVPDFENGPVKVASGGDLEVLVRADRNMPLVPETVDVRYWTADGVRGRARMTRLGAASGGQRWQEYVYVFRGVLAPIQFDVVGGDDAVRGLRILVVKSPTLEMTVEQHFPDYMERRDASAAATSVMQIPIGARLTFRARANKELVRAQVDFSADQKTPEASRVFAAKDMTADRMGFRCEWGPLTRDTTLSFSLLDADGIKTREPIQLALAAVADEPPQVTARLSGIGSAIVPQARLPVAGTATDDYGIARVWFECAIDQRKPSAIPALAPRRRTTELPLDGIALEASELKLKPGQKLLVCLKAADYCNLRPQPNVGVGERWLLDVVAPEQLRAMLEARELVQRQRLEAIIQDVAETRDLLLRTEFQRREGKDGKTADEPGEETAETEKPSPQRQLALRTLRVQQALQNSRKSGQETEGVAEAIDDICRQLSNNRIDTEELKLRLGQGIAEPLHKVAGQMFPELERRVEALEAAVADSQLGPQRRRAAQEQIDQILLAMRKALGRMIEMEDFNELVASLRAIIRAQDRVTEETKQRHKQRLQELLEK